MSLKKELHTVKTGSFGCKQRLLRQIVVEFLKETASLGVKKVTLQEGDIVNAILYHNQSIVDELRNDDIIVNFDYCRDLVINWE